MLCEVSQNGLKAKIPEFPKIHALIKKCPMLHKHKFRFSWETIKGLDGAFSSPSFNQFTWEGNIN